ncbi:ARM repeat superfamily protein, putative isoform 1 [Theobroma cacao]|uniref:ARM repeat superfamily protein, putative isoform 1 n=1 Tax=Theobroma cacao TaxID=3641 RepID=A0A061EPT0_THECC|nr:ARM repeat superfamily protein, putative isoform 1 [Theobroma cacao]EOY07060.1 ARM repeat superfamily protein, putative isoform 1 [Theobroma cacao]EOY07061.1 ARM repeat superfamily protein, putative isoform 1 [Theobroma cacao]
MEQLVMNSIEQSLDNNQPLSFQTLASIRSLVINPSTSDSTLSSVLNALTRSLQLSRDSVFLHHVVKLLTDLSSRCPHLSPVAIDLLRSNSLFTSSDSPRLVGESLSALVSLTSSQNDVDDARFVSLCLSPSVSVRLWLLRNAEKFAVRDSVLLAVFLGFTRDPYPYVRKAALDGLVKLCEKGDFDDHDVAQGCYFRAVELLCDAEDCVRSPAVRAVCGWGKMIVVSTEERNKQDLADAVFIQLCCMVRDMSMEVRLEAFDALGKIGLVSEDILLQTVSKKVLGMNKEKIYKPIEGLEISASGAAGAFVHGLEDEFSEVRMSACYSLRTLTVFSLRFAGEALNLLMDMLNDDSTVVRLQALGTMHHMAISNNLKVEEIHMHRFLGTLFDSSSAIRFVTRKILKLAKLPKLGLFKLCIDGLLGNLETYPEDEVDVFSVLFHIGRNHGKFTVCMIEEVSSELEPAFGGKLGFDSTRVAAFLVLAISVPLSHEKDARGVPPRIFSYAVTWLGRISHALSDLMSQETLLAYLSECSRSSIISLADFKIKDALPTVEGDMPSHLCSDVGSPVRIPLWQQDGETSDHHHTKLWSLGKSATHAEYELGEHDELRKSLNLIFRKVKDLWPLVQLGCTNEALKAIRACKEEVASYTAESPGSAGAVAFTLQYLRITKLLVAVWEHLLLTKKLNPYGVGKLELLLAKLDRRLREINNRFIGLSKGEELQIMDLIVVACLLRLSKVEIYCYETAMKKLSSTISHVEFLHKEGSIEPSHFMVEVKKSLHEVGSSIGGNTCKPLLFKKLVDSFSFEQFVLCASPRYLNAELEVPGNDSESPLPFISGIPASIPLVITLHNISSDNKLWLRISMSEESTQFVFLDLNLIRGNNEVRKFTFVAPFYLTPKAVSFTLRVSIGMECMGETLHLVKTFGGPKCELTYLSPEKEIFLCKSTKC